MMRNSGQTLSKAERLCSKKLVDQLFKGGQSRSMAVFPLRLVYRTDEMPATDEAQTTQAQVLVSVSKRHFHHAVDRNRVKRQVREAYRKNKALLLDVLAQQPERRLNMAFIWMTDELADTARVERSVKTLLQKLCEKLKPSA